MTGNVYNIAVDRISQLQAELQALEALVAVYERQTGEWHNDEREILRVTARRRPTTTSQVELERSVEQILIANGAPMTRGAILPKLKDAGVVVGGRNELANLGAKLSRAANLVNVPGLGYWPKGLTYETATQEGDSDDPGAA